MRSTSVVGIAVLVIGIIIIISGAVMMMSMGSTTPTNTNLLASNSYTVAAGDNQAIGFSAPSGSKVSGTFSQNASSINLYFMTANQQNAFGNCAPCSSPSLANITAQKTYNFNWAINSTGGYYLVLDNSKGGGAVSVSLTANDVASSGSASSSLPLYLIVVGIIVAIIGAIIAAMGSRGPKAPAVQRKPETTATPPTPPPSPPTTSVYHARAFTSILALA